MGPQTLFLIFKARGRIDVLVGCAGVYEATGTWDPIVADPAAFRSALNPQLKPRPLDSGHFSSVFGVIVSKP